MQRRWFALIVIACLLATVLVWLERTRIRPESDSAYHVYPGQSIQAVLDVAANDPDIKLVRVHEGTYRPSRRGQALVWLHAKHSGITLEAIGNVILTAANPEIARAGEDGHPAIVNHVVYFGDGIQPDTRFRGFKITGANNFVMWADDPENPIQPPTLAPGMQKEMFFYCDGGGIKIFGRSYPTIEDVEIYDCYSSPCGAGISIEHRGDFAHKDVRLNNCVFRGNRCPATGSAVDLLWGSRAVITNCLFIGNLSNEPMDARSASLGFWKPDNGAGALTILPDSRVSVDRCTFVGNRNAVDDSGSGSLYTDSIFWKNNEPGGWPPESRYELDVVESAVVRGCMINGDINDLNGTVDAQANTLDCEDPQFDASYRPQAKAFADVGYRPGE